MSQEAISAVEAVLVLTQCKEIAEKLVSSGSWLHLNKEDWATLKRYRLVQQAGWTTNQEVLGIAGLSPSQVQALDQALVKEGTW